MSISLPQGTHRLLFFALALLFIPALVWGACTWQWDCSNGYPCKQIPVCANAYDTPPPMLPGVSPMPPPAPPAPIAPITQPPGATSCRQVYICNGTGECAYQQVCQ